MSISKLIHCCNQDVFEFKTKSPEITFKEEKICSIVTFPPPPPLESNASCQNSFPSHNLSPKTKNKANQVQVQVGVWCKRMNLSEDPSRRTSFPWPMKMKGNSFLPSLHQSVISLALRTNELDEKIHLSIPLSNHGEMEPPH
jgi:hypothetical protein